jgi:hypothetical protein
MGLQRRNSALVFACAFFALVSFGQAFPLWLDSPTGRTNPHDPRSGLFHPTPTTLGTPVGSLTVTATVTPPLTQTPTATPTAVPSTPSPTATPLPANTILAPCNGAAMSLDGVLNEPVYGETPFISIPSTNCSAGCGTADSTASAQFKAIWNSQGLWIGVVVSDPGNLYADSGTPWDGSAVEVYLDATNAKAGWNGISDYVDPNTYRFTISYDSSIFAEYYNTTFRTILAASVVTPGVGYTMEIEIPWANLGLSAPVGGAFSGLNVGVDVSNAAGSARDHQIVAYNPVIADRTPSSWVNLLYQTCY